VQSRHPAMFALVTDPSTSPRTEHSWRMTAWAKPTLPHRARWRGRLAADRRSG
jgi:hypothetical protein